MNPPKCQCSYSTHLKGIMESKGLLQKGQSFGSFLVCYCLLCLGPTPHPLDKTKQKIAEFLGTVLCPVNEANHEQIVLTLFPFAPFAVVMLGNIC